MSSRGDYFIPTQRVSDNLIASLASLGDGYDPQGLAFDVGHHAVTTVTPTRQAHYSMDRPRTVDRLCIQVLLDFLTYMPYEIFAEICSHLEPVWLWNLAHACRTNQLRLSFSNGNFLWFKSLPASLWMEPGYLHSTTIDPRYAANLFAFDPTIQALESSSVSPGDRHANFEVKLLGLQYQPHYDYRWDLKQRWHFDDRCGVCFCTDTEMRMRGRCERYGMLWCKGCNQKYTISNAVALRICSELQIAMPLLYAYQSFVDAHGNMMHYLPPFDDYLRRTGQPYDAKTTLRLLTQQAALLREQRLTPDSVKERRFGMIRARILSAAQLLWLGRDPQPNWVYDPVLGHDVAVPRAWVTRDANDYAWARTSFAPTVGRFLFPAHKVWINNVFQNQDGGFPEYEFNPHTWLPDPVNEIAQRSPPNYIIDLTWLVQKARIMLRALVFIHGPTSNRPQHAGMAGAWVAATREHHIQRLNRELDFGFPLMTAPQQLQHLRRCCGLPDPSGVFQSLQDRRVVSFNRILRHACGSCPFSGGLFFPVGIEGLVKHVLDNHPVEFWQSDNWHIMG